MHWISVYHDSHDTKASVASFQPRVMLHSRGPELSLTRSWIKTRGVQITASKLAQQTGWCLCYLLHPGDPDTTQQSEEMKDLRVSGVNKQEYEQDMNIWGWGAEGIRQQGKEHFMPSLFTCTEHSDCLTRVCKHIPIYKLTHTQMAGGVLAPAI